jgi:hypothetical protein
VVLNGKEKRNCITIVLGRAPRMNLIVSSSNEVIVILGTERSFQQQSFTSAHYECGGRRNHRFWRTGTGFSCSLSRATYESDPTIV